MSKSNNLGDFLTGIADAIRAKNGSSALIDPQDFDTEIANLPSGSKLPQVVDKSITSITAEDLGNISTIGYGAFNSCNDLETVVLPSTITKIMATAFSYCGKMSSITIQEGLENIYNQAFLVCSSLTSVELPSTLLSIGQQVFSNCSSLQSVTIKAITPPTLSNINSFDGSYPIYVPAGSVSAYQSASVWSGLSSRIQAIPPLFQTMSWSEIRNAVRNGTASNYFAVGDTRTVTLTNNTTMTVRIADMTTGRYDFADNSGNKSNMVIEFVDCFADTAPMNSTDTNVGGWASCAMRSTTMPSCLALLPTDMQNAMSEVTVLSGTGNGSTSGTSSSANKLFLPCEYEIFGTQTYSIGSSEAGPGGQFEYYTAHNTAADCIKYRAGTAQVWWLRSPRSSGSDRFCTVYSNGSANSSTASNQRGVSPVFAI